MRKKAKRKKASAKARFSFIRVIYVVAAFMLLFGFGYFYLNHSTNPCANSISCIKDLSGKYEPNEKEAVFMGRKVTVPSEIAQNITEKPVLGETTPSNKRIFIDLANQRVYAYEGDKLVYSFLVSTGKWGRTPTGEFRIWVKLRYTRMSGGNSAIGTYYNLPNVPFVMFFYNNEIPKSMGYSLHGTYWHNNFGHVMSHGCVNMKTEEAEKIYYWADPPTNGNLTYATNGNPGTPIIIYGQASME